VFRNYGRLKEEPHSTDYQLQIHVLQLTWRILAIHMERCNWSVSKNYSVSANLIGQFANLCIVEFHLSLHSSVFRL